MINLLTSARDNERNKDYSFFLSGDLNQMSIQKSFLTGKGFDVKQNNVYPCLQSLDVERALTLIWQNKVEGWWHYEDQYIKHNICTKEEFRNRLCKS